MKVNQFSKLRTLIVSSALFHLVFQEGNIALNQTGSSDPSGEEIARLVAIFPF